LGSSSKEPPRYLNLPGMSACGTLVMPRRKRDLARMGLGQRIRFERSYVDPPENGKIEIFENGKELFVYGHKTSDPRIWRAARFKTDYSVKFVLTNYDGEYKKPDSQKRVISYLETIQASISGKSVKTCVVFEDELEDEECDGLE
jgi:hypothetical protein